MYWPDLGKVQEIGDMNIVSQMCAIAVMFVIMYFYISQKKIILHTSKAFVEVWIQADRKSTRLNSSHASKSRMPSSA